MQSPTAADICANYEPAEPRHREWETTTVCAASGAVTHWPLYFEDPFEDKGHGRRLIVRDWDVAPQPIGLQRLSEFPNLTGAMVRRGWSETRIRKVLGENWVSFLREVWGE